VCEAFISTTIDVLMFKQVLSTLAPRVSSFRNHRQLFIVLKSVDQRNVSCISSFDSTAIAEEDSTTAKQKKKE
jgi:hypothetical protein